MDSFYHRIFPRIADVVQHINEQRHLHAVRTAFITTMPLMIASAFAVAINNLPIPAYQDWMNANLGEYWRQFGGMIYDGTMSIIALIAVYAICSNLASWYNQHRRADVHPVICSITGVACYVIMALPADGGGLSFGVTNVTGLFVGILIALFSTECFIKLHRWKREQRILSDEPNVAVPMSFRSIVPVLAVLGVFSLARVIMITAGQHLSLTQIVYEIISRPFQVNELNLGTAQVFNISTHLFWTLGMHGNNVMDQVAQNVFVPAAAENVAAFLNGLPPPNTYNKTMLDVFVYTGGSGATLCLVIAMMIFGRSNSHRQLMRYALPTSIFNINEPMIFGIPIVLNPIFFFPFILTPVLLLFTTALAMETGLVPRTISEVNWTAPLFISGYTATGSIAGSILQLVNLALGTMVYAPFIRLNEAIQRRRYDRAYEQLCKLLSHEYGESARNLTQRTDEIGAVARSLANNLHNVIQNNELYLVYQPIVDSRTSEMVSVESLLRWKHPVRGIINPMLAVALAEEIKQIDAIGLWVLQESVRQIMQWREKGLDVYISVNVSAQQLINPQFAAQAMRIVEEYKAPPSIVQLEITETLSLAEDQTTISNLRKLYEYGMKIAIDDFGMGHSSLVYLRSQPITTLKVDGSLSRDILTQPANLEIISSIADLCNMLDVKMVIEYVEQKQQVEKLQSIGAFFIQGYYYSPPLPADKVLTFSEEVRARKDEMQPFEGEDMVSYMERRGVPHQMQD